MDDPHPNKPGFSIRRKFMFLFVLVITLALSLGQAGLGPASAIWNQPPDPIDPDPIGSPVQFSPPADGFTWTVPPRFGKRDSYGLIDFHWNAQTMTYDPTYIYPSNWPMYFYGCQTQPDHDNPQATPNTYKWELDGKVIEGHSCMLAYDNPGFSAQGTYTVKLTVTDPNSNPIPAGKDPAYFQQEVYIKDYFIISIGDSFASGEGNPDIQQGYQSNAPLPGWHQTAPPVWEDKRCNRSSYAGPAQAAMELEASDPHTSVTFISFACAGATINTFTYGMIGLNIIPPFLNLDPDSTKPQGTGVLGKYYGIEPDGVNYGDYDHYIPSQISQVQTAITPPAGKPARTIDSLIISAGGNDLHFGDIAKTCLVALTDDCWKDARAYDDPNSGSMLLRDLVHYVLTPHAQGGSTTSIPDNFDLLANAIQNLKPNPAKVYITQYPDLTRDDSGGYCRMMDDVFWPLTYAITPQEAETAAQLGLGGLNLAVKNAAAKWGWQLVDGLASYEVDPEKAAHTPGEFVQDENGKGHGYCASDNWIRRADESELIQGPVDFRMLSNGTLHPTIRGHQAIKERILYYMLPDLQATLPSIPPKFTTSYTSGNLTSTPGANNWYIGSCAGSTCYPKAVLQVTVKGTTPLRGASVSLNDQAGCGSLCTTTISSATNEVKWNFTFTNDGIYRMQFSAKDATGLVTTYGTEIKVDLHDPYFNADPGPFSVDEGGSVTLSAQASDAASGTLNYDWDLNNDGTFETTDEQPNFSAASLDGPTSQTVSVRVTDEAGNSTTATATVNVENVAPTPVINGAPVTSPEGTTLTLTSTVTDPGTADTFSYAWTVEKNGNSYASGSDAKISFTPDDNGIYDITLSVTDDDSDTGTTNKTIEVTNVAPSLSISDPVSGSLYGLNTQVNLSASISDPGIQDTLTCSVVWDDGTTSSPTVSAGSCAANHSYPTAGVYTLQITAKDKDGGSDTQTVMVVVYDPSAGFVTGGGWIDSPAGAYIADPTFTGKANFGFVAKYQKGASSPTGGTQFQFLAGGFYFESSAYDWLVVSGAKAQFKGTGLVNGVPGYSFLLTATDGQVTGGGGLDMFRIKIWDTNGTVYDNALDSSDDLDAANPELIGGGNIVIHSNK